MSITIIHSNSAGIEEPFKKIDQRTSNFDTKTIVNIEEIRMYLTTITDQRVINAIITSLVGEKFHNKFAPYIIQYYQTIQMKKFLTTIKTKYKTNKSKDLADLHNSKHAEFTGINIGLDHNVVCVESGILCTSAGAIHDMFSPESIICLHSNHESTILANEFLSLSERKSIECETNDGSTFNYSGFDRVYIPNIVVNKDAVLKQIIATGEKEVRILVQYATGLTQLLYNNYSYSDKNFGIQQRIQINRAFSSRELHQLYIV